MKTIYFSRTVSERNIKHGYFEKNDFGEIEIVNLNKENAEACIEITESGEKKKMIRLLGKEYITSDIILHFSREEEASWLKKQGHWTEKTCRALGVAIRKGCDCYYPAENKILYLWGKTLYQPLCKVNELSITECGNTLFGDWWSIDIEPHHQGKGNTKFSKDKFLKVLKAAKLRIAKMNAGNKNGKKVNLFYPTVKWY